MGGISKSLGKILGFGGADDIDIKPPAKEVEANESLADREAAEKKRKRKGVQANILAGEGTTTGAVASKTLTGQ